MAYAVPFTATAGAVLTAAIWNVVRDDQVYFKDVLAGTNADKLDGAALAHPLTRNAGGNQTDGIEWVLSGGFRAHIQPILAVGLFLAYNGYYDGTNWQRDGTANGLTRLQLDNSGLFFGKAAAGANPATITEVLYCDLNGKLNGLGFYSSGEVSVGSGGSSALTHGLGARPRIVTGFYHTSSTTEEGKALPLIEGNSGNFYLSPVTGTQITINNLSGASIYAHVYAIR